MVPTIGPRPRLTPAGGRSDPPRLAASLPAHVGHREVTGQDRQVGQPAEPVGGLDHLVDLEPSGPPAVVAGPDLHPGAGLQPVVYRDLVHEPCHRPTSSLSSLARGSSCSAGAVPATGPEDGARAGRPD